MRRQRLGLELRMKLAAKEEGMAGNLDNFYVGSVRRGTGETKAAAGETR